MFEIPVRLSRRQIVRARFLVPVLAAALAAVAAPQAALGQNTGVISLTKIVAPDPAGVGGATLFTMKVTCATPVSGTSYIETVRGNTSLKPTHKVPIGSRCQVVEVVPHPFHYYHQICTWLPPVYTPSANVVVTGPIVHVTVKNSYHCV